MLMVQSSLSHCQPMFPSPQVDETPGPAPPAVRLTIRLPGSILSWRTLVTPQIHRYKRHLELYNSIPVGKCTWKQVYFRKTLKLFSPCILFGILVHLSSGHMYVSKTFYSLFVNGLFITNTLYYKSSMLYILQKSSMLYVFKRVLCCMTIIILDYYYMNVALQCVPIELLMMRAVMLFSRLPERRRPGTAVTLQSRAMWDGWWTPGSIAHLDLETTQCLRGKFVLSLDTVNQL